MATAVDKGKLIWAKYPGDCAECGGTIAVGQPVYYSKHLGSRHRTCVDRGPRPDGGDAAPETAAPRETAARLPFDDDTPRARDNRPRGDVPAAAGDDAYIAPARDTAFSRAGDRDAARRELAGVLRLLIEALVRIERMLE